MKKIKIIYWISTGLLGALLLMSAGMYFFNNAAVQEAFSSFGYPVYLIYPLALATISPLPVLLSQQLSRLKEWAYAALFFEFLLAFFAHVMISDGDQMGAVVALILLLTSYVSGNKLFNTKNN